MCPIRECEDSGLDPAVTVVCHSYEGALNYIFNVKNNFPHLRLQYNAKHDMLVWNFKSDSERTYFILTAENYR